MPKSRSRVSPFMKQCFVTGAVCSNIIGHGCVIGFPAVLLPQLHEPGSRITLTKEADSWIASVMGIALLVGNFITPSIMDRFGRKMAHYAVTLPVIVGWFIIILATNVKALIFGRILQGLSFGMLMPLRSVLIGEYTSPNNRGAFLTTVSLAQAFGIFFVHLVGSLLTWEKTSLICVFFSFTSLVMTIHSPESPSFLAAKGRYDECRKVFRWLRGEEEDEELEEMIQARILIDKEKTGQSELRKNQCSEAVETIKKKEFYKPIVLMLHAYTMTQFAGGTTMASYSITIIGSLMGPDANTHFWMIALDTQRIFSNAVAVYVINKTRRRTMVFATGGLCVISHLAIAGYLYTKIKGSLFYDAPWIPILLINMHFFSVATGMVPLPSVIAGEVFPLEYRSIGGSISLVAVAGGMFLVLKTFPALLDNIGLHGTYTLYAVILSYNLAVIWYLLPETKGRTLQQIEDEFRGRPLKPEELEVRMSLQSSTLDIYKREMSARRCSSPILH